MEVSTVSAMAASSGRSRSKRPTNSDEKCWASAAEPPLPPLVTQARMACTAAAIGLLSTCAAWYLRSALSMKCCWIRCSSMGGDDTPRATAQKGARNWTGARSARVERRAQPLDVAVLDADDVEAARRLGSKPHQEVPRGE